MDYLLAPLFDLFGPFSSLVLMIFLGLLFMLLIFLYRFNIWR